MKGTVLYGPRDVRFEEREDPQDSEPDGCDHPFIRHLRVRLRLCSPGASLAIGHELVVDGGSR